MPLRNEIDNIFLDRDGVINIDSGYVHTWSKFEFIEGTLEALKYLTKLGIRLIIVTNQGGIAKGFYTEEDFQELNKKMLDTMHSHDIKILDTFHCPHHKDGKIPELSKDCNYRKPKPGMILAAAKKYSLDLSRSIILGDNESDLIAGKNANLYQSILIEPTYELCNKNTYIDGCFENLNNFVFNHLEK
tara:strand:+ start:210 stop:773 length:564 start_codon:yes stop_codon:yes gene_type:complete